LGLGGEQPNDPEYAGSSCAQHQVCRFSCKLINTPSYQSYGYPEINTCDFTANCDTLGYTSKQYVEVADRELMKIGVKFLSCPIIAQPINNQCAKIRGWTVVVAGGDSGATNTAQNWPIAGSSSSSVAQLVISNGTMNCIFPTGGPGEDCRTLLDSFNGPCLTEWSDYVGNGSNRLPVYGGCLVDVTNFDFKESVTPRVVTNCTVKQFPFVKKVREYPSIPLKNLFSGCQGNCSFSAWVYNVSLGASFAPDYPATSPYVLSGLLDAESFSEIC